MLSKLNKQQRDWLRTAPKEEIRAFLANGEPEVAEMIDSTNFESCYRAGIRGVVLGGKTFPTSQAAYEYAESEREAMIADDSLPVLNERVLGIDGTNTAIREQMEQATLRAEEIVHLGAMCADGYSLSDPLVDFIDELDSFIVNNLADEMPWLKSMFEAWQHKTRSNLRCEFEEFLDQCYKHACHGFLVKFATPKMAPHQTASGEWGGASYSWSCYTTTWVYAETFEEAIHKGLKWADNNRQEEIVKESAQ